MSQEPRLNPMPGRVIVKLVERLTRVPGTTFELSDKYQYQPYIGEVLAIGDPLNETQEKLCEELARRADAGHRAIFSWGSGTCLDSSEMLDLAITRKGSGGDDGGRYQPFAWLTSLRTFRIEDFAQTLEGGDSLGGWDPMVAEIGDGNG